MPAAIIAVIPARLTSSRLPRKVLRDICGRPMLAYIYEAAQSAGIFSQVIIASDSEEVLGLCRRQGWDHRLTSQDHRSGTERVHEVACAVKADIYVNIQGDEPLATAQHLTALVAPFARAADVQVATLKTPCPEHDVANPNAVKVVTDLSGRALYFSRSTVPHDRDKMAAVRYFKHLGFYAYTRNALDLFCSLPESELERSERLEQLRFLENGVAIQVEETPLDTVGVDTEEDLDRVEEILRSRALP